MFVVVLGYNVPPQLRSYGDGTSVLSLIRKTGEARDRTHCPLVYKTKNYATKASMSARVPTIYASSKNKDTHNLCFKQ